MSIFSEYREAWTALKDSSEDVRENLAQVQKEAKKAQRVGASIQRSVSEFQYSAQPHIDKATEILAKYQTKEEPSAK